MIKSKYDITFTGFYGQKNYGDDLFCTLLAQFAPNHWCANRIGFMGYDLPSTSGVHSSFLFGGRRVFKGQAQIDYRLQPYLTNWVIYGGGSIFHSDYRYNLKGRILAEASDRKQIKLGAVGVSLGPFLSQNAMRSVENYLRRFKFITLRDELSMEIIADFSLPETKVIGAFDLAGLLPLMLPPQMHNVGRKKKVFGVSLCGQLPFEEIKTHVNKTKMLISRLSKVFDLKVMMYVLNTHDLHGESKLYQAFEIDSPNYEVEIVYHNENPLKTCERLLECDSILAVRLHAGITAGLLSIPFVQVEYHEKCSSFLDSIDYLTERRVGNLDICDEELFNIVSLQLDKGETFIPKFRRNELIKLAQKSFKETAEFFLSNE